MELRYVDMVLAKTAALQFQTRTDRVNSNTPIIIRRKSQTGQRDHDVRLFDVRREPRCTPHTNAPRAHTHTRTRTLVHTRMCVRACVSEFARTCTTHHHMGNATHISLRALAIQLKINKSRICALSRCAKPAHTHARTQTP